MGGILGQDIPTPLAVAFTFSVDSKTFLLYWVPTLSKFSVLKARGEKQLIVPHTRTKLVVQAPITVKVRIIKYVIN